jgi:TonB-dependent starch-binding outer membrane protein SusC
MKKKLTKTTALAIMKLSFIHVFILLFVCCSFSREINGQGVLDKIVTVDLKNEEVKKIILELEKVSGIHFVYSPQVIQSSRKADIKANQEKLGKVLEEFLKPLFINYEVVDDYIVLNTPNIVAAKVNDRTMLKETLKEEGYDEKVITGVITDEKDIPLSDVSVKVKGTDVGTTTNGRGIFKLTIPSDNNAVLLVSSVGYITQEIAVGNNANYTVKLKPTDTKLEEVVMVAYGSKTKKDLTGSVSSIRANDISKSVALSPQQAMQGRMPGVFVSSSGGDPNNGPVIRIRGVTTFSGTNDPLYVIDGVVIDEYGSRSTFTIGSVKANDIKGTQNIFNLINPADIESISVLKDASSAAAYGARAANGVILITTKKGKEGRAKLNFSAQKGVANIIKKMKLLSTKEYVDLVNLANAGNPNYGNEQFDVFKADNPKYLGNSATYDWQDAVINKNAAVEDYNLSVSGGTQNATYFVGGGFAHQESALKFNAQKRYSLTARTEYKISKYFELGQTLRLAYTDLNNNRDNTGVPTNLYNVIRTSPWQPIYNANGFNGYQEIASSNQYGRTTSNWLGTASVTNNDYGTFKLLGSAYATVIPVKNLRITGTIGTDYFTGRRVAWAKKEDALFSGNGPGGLGNRLQEVNSINYMLSKRISADYNLFAGSHSVNIYAHAESQVSRWSASDASRAGITDVDDPELFNINGKNADATTWNDKNAFINYLGRISYKYSDKYYLDITALRQGTSVFNPKDRQWGTFPSVAGAWRISKESFFKNLPFDDFKIKAGVGQLGNADASSFQYLSLVNNAFASYIIGGTPIVGAFLSNYPNANLTWEKITTYNIGFESVFKKNITFSFEYYKRLTKDILQPYSLPATAGVSTNPYKNIGSAQNTGIELTLGYQNKIKDFNYNVGFNLTTTSNKVTKLDNNLPVGTPAGFVILGDPINSIYGYKVDGVIKTQAQLDAYKAKYPGSPLISELQVGDLMYQDIGGAPGDQDVKAGRITNSTPDGKIDGFDGRARLGKSIPGFFYGITLGGDYKGFDFSILLQGVGDVQTVNSIKQANTGYDLGNQLKSALDYWSTTNPNSNNPRAIAYGASAGNNGNFSDRFVESGSFLRLANLQIGYTLPQKIFAKTGAIDNIRFFVSGSNLFLITKYTGYDPENDFLPAPRSILGGIKISF